VEQLEGTAARILEATREVLCRNGQRKLSMWDVAAEAEVSRPTLYRWFPSKVALLDAFGLYEQQKFDLGMGTALNGLKGLDALDAALVFIADFQHGYVLSHLSAIEPEHVVFQMTRSLPIMRRRIEGLIPGPDSATIAGTIVRVAMCHFVIDGDDRDQLLEQLRTAAGIVVT
jgi:AcrR family transcriptional regulator